MIHQVIPVTRRDKILTIVESDDCVGSSEPEARISYLGKPGNYNATLIFDSQHYYYFFFMAFE